MNSYENSERTAHPRSKHSLASIIPFLLGMTVKNHLNHTLNICISSLFVFKFVPTLIQELQCTVLSIQNLCNVAPYMPHVPILYRENLIRLRNCTVIFICKSWRQFVCWNLHSHLREFRNCSISMFRQFRWYPNSVFLLCYVNRNVRVVA